VSAYSVEFTARARKELWDLPKPIQRRIVRVLPLLGASPRQGANIKPLKGHADGYRLRVGDYRVLYQVQEAHLVVLVVKVAHRREAYRGR
jgi:mRNA interferase RelE/StbE